MISKTTVVLQPYGTGPYIKAPSFCPYKSFEPISMGTFGLQGGVFTVNSSFCPLCKICTFVPETTDGLPPTQQEREIFAKHLTAEDLKLGASISGQNQFLSKNDRIPLAVLISVSVLKEMLQKIESEKRRQELLSLYLNQEIPVCHILGCPVYFSRKLTKSRIQLVGEIEWR